MKETDTSKWSSDPADYIFVKIEDRKVGGCDNGCIFGEHDMICAIHKLNKRTGMRLKHTRRHRYAHAEKELIW